jgi:glycosyltransferase involved in cell wall biosynthesis
MAPRVSTIIRTYNRADYLGAAIDSVLAQSYHDHELLVVDDGSTDETLTLLAGYGDRLRTLALPHSGNLALLGNAGIRAARGEFIAFLDSDDLWLPDKLERQLRRLDGEARFGFAYGNACLLYPDGTRSAPVLAPDQIVAGSVLRAMVRNMCVHISTVLIRRRCFDEVGWFDERHASAEDIYFFLDLARATAAVCAPEAVALIRQHGQQMSSGLGLSRYEEAARALGSLLADSQLPWDVRLEAHRSIARYETHVARVLIEHGRAAEARPHLLNALRHYPLHRPLWRWLGRSQSRTPAR